jgi:hypothetical protein
MESELPDCHEGSEAYERFDATNSGPVKYIFTRMKDLEERVGIKGENK